jgi:hypothetical protein
VQNRDLGDLGHWFTFHACQNPLTLSSVSSTPLAATSLALCPRGQCPAVPLKYSLRSSILFSPLLGTNPSRQEEALPGRNGSEARRSSRVFLRVPLQIFEPGTNKRFVVGDAYTVKVSLWGGLLALDSSFNQEQKLLLVNPATGESKESHVVYLGPLHGNKRLVGVEFLESAPNFWGLNFPPVVPRRSPSSPTSHERRSYYA